MASTSETGHAKNVATFEDLISFVKGLETKYNPSKDTIQVTALEAMRTNATNALSVTKTAQTAFDNATNKRGEAFEYLRKLSTRVVSAFSVYATEADLKDLKSIQRKIQGTRAGKTNKPPAEGEQQSGKTISVSQQSYDSLTDHFIRMIEVVKASIDYKPNEPELTVAGLKQSWMNYRPPIPGLSMRILTGITASSNVMKHYIHPWPGLWLWLRL